jgi:hypothetical protein
MLETKRQAANIVAMEKESDVLNPETEQLRGQYKEAATLKEQKDNLLLGTNAKQ